MIRLSACLFLCAALSATAGGASKGLTPETIPVEFQTPDDSPLQFRGGLIIRPPHADFGGLSGLALEGARKAVLVSDKGAWVRLSLDMENGTLTGVDDVRISPILDAEGNPVSEGAVDAEDLTRDPQSGALWVSFERDHRIWRFDEGGGTPQETLRHPKWETYAKNTGLEALARDDDGRIWAIREASGDYAKPFPVFVWDGERFEEKRLPRPSRHLVTGADFGPDGWLYITERKFAFTSGFEIRLRRLKYGDGPDPVADETLIALPSQSNIDNIEGIEVWREGGETLILIASDDNMFLLQRNILALFAIRGGG